MTENNGSPRSKVIQLVMLQARETIATAIEYLALCQDGSIYRYRPNLIPGHRWEALDAFNGDGYEDIAPRTRR